MSESENEPKPVGKTILPIWRCLRCGHSWCSRTKEAPVCCAKCSSPYWNREKRQPKAEPVAIPEPEPTKEN